ncbi:hydroxypyruvate isomerase family protein [Pseudooceanicola sp. HF7]|uniref:hydroxypyruvate isomerase family protein n=1 Tax=Pseudooceanicola sp. HF7 TaxID=2721560 RepID=UPI001431B207|nr:TIM barrel protein [Pseudooceanicola sp. HF7]NIZ09111.1 TIM barrel protein [Pseudooceanicola sp. HF7]
MLKFAANLSGLFCELPVQDRVLAAADAGFDAVEIPFPYDAPAMDLRNALGFTGLPVTMIAAPPPNYTGGTAGYAALPGGQTRFQHDFRRALRYAQALKAHHIHVLSGAAHGQEAFETLVENLTWACDFAPRQSLVIEPMNTADLPGYFLDSPERAAEVIEAAGRKTLGLQFDAYHIHKITGDVPGSWQRFGHLARHVQIAAAPDQGEPDRGGIDFAAFFDQLRHDGYAGWIGADYRPRGQTTKGLGWLAAAQEGTGSFKKQA